MLTIGDGQGPPQTYIIAQNPAVLAQLMRENESRTLNPSAYTTPASVFNTIAVDIDSEKTEPTLNDVPVLPLKTLMLPASELLKLDPIVDQENQQHQIFDDDLINNSSKASTLDRYIVPQDALLSHGIIPQSQPPAYPIPCEIISSLTHQSHSLDPMYNALTSSNNGSLNGSGDHQGRQQQFMYTSTVQTQHQFIPTNMNFFQQNPLQNVPCTSNLPPHCEISQKSRSLERNTPANLTYAARISSLERIQNTAKQTRSNSLTRQLSNDSTANPGYVMNARSASLERGATAGMMYSARTNSLERNNQTQMMPGMSESHRGGSLERNQSIASTYDLMKMRGYRGGSLERNHQGIAMVGRSASLERNTQYQAYRDQFRQQANSTEPEPFQEEIYDFGGANVKSCASIALNKSISKGLLPPGTKLPNMHTHQQPQTKNTGVASNAGLPPLHSSPAVGYISSSFSLSAQQAQPLQQQSQQPSSYESQAYAQNSIYTPMYPRMWSSTQQAQTSGASHLVYIQQPQPNMQNIPMQATNYVQSSQNKSQMLTQSGPLIAQVSIPNVNSNASVSNASVSGLSPQVCQNFCKNLKVPAACF